MARSKKSKDSARPSRRGKDAGKSGRASRATAEAVEVEVVEEAAGMGIDDGIAIFTTILLIAACIFIELELSGNYGAGWFMG